MARPTKYKQEMCEQVIECGKQGMSRAEICNELDIHHSTFAAWQEEKPEFSAAVKEAMLHCQGWWERVGRMATIGQVDNFNATAFVFNMKNRFPNDWRDKREVEQSGELGLNVSKVAREIVDP